MFRQRFDSFITVDGRGAGSDPAAVRYIQSVMDILRTIEASQTGKALFAAMRATGKQLTILPYRGRYGVCNADAIAAEAEKANVKGEYMLDGKGKVLTETTRLKELLGLPGEPVMARGGGSASTIEFSPGLFATPYCRAVATAPGMRDSEVLFHEMVHGYRGMRGIQHFMQTVGGRKNYGNLEEFAAVVITNIYISETRGPEEPLTADHMGNSPPLSEATSSTFLAIRGNRNLTNMLKNADPAFFQKLGDVSAAFNPFTSKVSEVGPVVVFRLHPIKPGDTLSRLAAKYYGTEDYWPLIWGTNRETVPNPNLLTPYHPSDPEKHPLQIAPISSFTTAQLEEAKRIAASWKNYPHGPDWQSHSHRPKPPAPHKHASAKHRKP